MRPAVELCPRAGIREPERRAQVHHQRAPGKLPGQRGGLRVRERHEHQVGTGQRRGIGGAEDPSRKAGQVGVHLRHRCARVRPRRQRADLQVGVGSEQAEQFAARVTAGAGHRDPCTQFPRPLPVASSGSRALRPPVSGDRGPA